ncbi:hypothetical protein [Arthrobacter sp. 35W]|nr:hypothetical protein [Arthrobacter sp. 35W]
MTSEQHHTPEGGYGAPEPEDEIPQSGDGSGEASSSEAADDEGADPD